MKLSPFIRPNRGSRTRLLTLAAAGTATLGLASLAVVNARPALADPANVYIAVGAETTQDVMDQFATDLAGNELGSYNAVNPVTNAQHEFITPVKAVSTPVDCSFERPNGNPTGLRELRQSINPSSTVSVPVGPQPGCIDIDRSLIGPGSDQRNDGQLVFIPFALDEVTGATGPAGTTHITTADDFTLTDLRNLYANCQPVTEGGVTYNPNTATAGQVQINLYVPSDQASASGEDTESYWASLLGYSATTPTTCVHFFTLTGPNAGQQVLDDDGTAVASDPNGYMPFSIAQWIGQRNGNDDRRHGAVIHNINGISPFDNGNPATGGLNTAFGNQREAYNVVQYDRVVNTGDGNFDQALASLLAGTGSALCQDTFTIQGLGFATTGQCGSTANTLRAFDSSDPV